MAGPTPNEGWARQWDDAFRTRGVKAVSWFQDVPTVSVELIDFLGIGRSVPILDVGGGASSLVDNLVAAAYSDVSVLDVSDVALKEAKRRLAAHPEVTWLHEDVLTWRPQRRYGLWHDRAVFHFLTTEGDREAYLATLAAGTEAGAGIIMATFALDGPRECSGLPVVRYGPDDLARVLGKSFQPCATRRELHTTPNGAIQPFTWIAGTWTAVQN